MAKIKLKLPKLGQTMEEGTISEWMVADGDKVSLGQEIYSIETDKSVQEVECAFRRAPLKLSPKPARLTKLAM